MATWKNRANRTTQFLVAITLALLALGFAPAEMRAAAANAPLSQQVLGTLLVTGAYLAIAGFSLKDLRASSLIAVVASVFLTPLFTLLLLFSGWSSQSWERAFPIYLCGIVGNAILFVSEVWSL